MSSIGVIAEDIHELSVELLGELEHIQPALASFGLIMTIGRILSPEPLNAEEELKFCQDLMDYVTVYFAKGRVH